METSIMVPNDLIEEILMRLPVKHLLPWKCVSKYCYALIRDDVFVKKHYRFQYAMHLADHDDVPLLLSTPTDFDDPIQFHLLLKHGARDVTVNFTPDFERDIPPPTLSSNSLPHEHRIFCIGIVNGIVGLLWGHRSHVVLWNPATREFKDVPCWPIMPDNKDAVTFGAHIAGFGFDLLSNDFKILGIIDTKESATDTVGIFEFHLYSLKANSWKRIRDTPRNISFDLSKSTDAYLDNGVYYWKAYEWDHRRPHGFVCFNFSSEIFKEFERPKVAETWLGCSFFIIGKYKEGLALLVDRTLKSEETCFEIWAATRFRDDDYEVPSSWQLVVKVPPICVPNGMWLRTILDSGDVLLNIHPPDAHEGQRGDGYFADGGAYVYHPSTRTFNYLGFRVSSSHRYVESLFPLSRRLNYTGDFM